MVNKNTTIFRALGQVYSHKKNFVLTMIVASFVFLFNTLITNYKLLASHFSILLLWSLIQGTLHSISPLSLFFLVLLSLFSGIVVSMSVHVLRKQIFLGAGAGSSGILVSILAPTCPSCALGLLSLLGLGGFLVVLPFKGLELGFLGIVLLIGSMIYLSSKIITITCKVKKKRV